MVEDHDVGIAPTPVNCTSKSRNEVKWIKIREIISTVDFNRLQQTYTHPEPNDHEVIAEKSNSYYETHT